MHPAESIQAHIDLKGRTLLPIHNGTFDLSMHSWSDPFERIAVLGRAESIPVLTPLIGETVAMHGIKTAHQCWKLTMRN